MQNATLAGGVAIGSVANLRLGIYPTATIGSLAGILSVLGYAYITVSIKDSIQNRTKMRRYFKRIVLKKKIIKSGNF